ncbi:hypothetical protein [Nostoc sp. MG11]|nr:hypothetical protein [Nostoc sp. MG11]
MSQNIEFDWTYLVDFPLYVLHLASKSKSQINSSAINTAKLQSD